jgi:hypothetical protein
MNMAKKNDAATGTAERVEENLRNLPMTSLALAGLLGAGIMALYSTKGLLTRRHK